MPRQYKTDAFQKRHYYLLAEKIAEAAKEARLNGADAARLFAAFARKLIGTNPGYDRGRFETECLRVWNLE